MAKNKSKKSPGKAEPQPLPQDVEGTEACREGGPHEWESLGGGYGGSSEGAAMEAAAGLWHTATCRKCGVITTLEGSGDDGVGDEGGW